MSDVPPVEFESRASAVPCDDPIVRPLHTLVYNELPLGSDLRREYGPGGAVTITAPAGEPSEAVRRLAALQTGLSAAIVCGAIVFLLVAWAAAAVLPAFRRLDPGMRLLAMLLFAVICGGLFLLVWKVRFANRLDRLEKARSQAIVIHADSFGVIVEATSPAGDTSYELSAADLRGIHVVVRDPDQTWGRPEWGPGVRLQIELANGSFVPLLYGRHPAEIEWVAASIWRALEGCPERVESGGGDVQSP